MCAILLPGRVNSSCAFNIWLEQASEGGRIDILREWEEMKQNELQQRLGAQVLLALKARPEPFPNGLPMPV